MTGSSGGPHQKTSSRPRSLQIRCKNPNKIAAIVLGWGEYFCGAAIVADGEGVCCQNRRFIRTMDKVSEVAVSDEARIR
jgi:hypothetical protein